MIRDVVFYAIEIGDYVTIPVDVRVNVSPVDDMVQIEIPRTAKHHSVSSILAKDKFRRNHGKK